MRLQAGWHVAMEKIKIAVESSWKGVNGRRGMEEPVEDSSEFLAPIRNTKNEIVSAKIWLTVFIF